ncbi:OLC1v1007454C1 [Oldenlandia corymbosa var. corymbosa]|uniref:OLC1v1007454C1 n=1 Tax=Oldenlandia corymbosa var. corymbosa TaxID=529605 RepID=A0AAV1DJV6_OLDCO|nr:OLC1v1007454C1 [Oldenlandia corymbosa var. corymbosa]
MTLEPEHVSSIPKTFKLLKVLEIQSLIFTRFPVDLCNLVLLKYISISTNFPTLPSSLSALWNLQTLIVSTTCRTLDIKADLWKMPHFRHLHTKVATTLTLCTISTESCKKEIFDQTPNLRKLGICGRLTNLFEVNGESSLLPQLYELESLTLLNDGKSCKLPRLPSKSSFPPWLRKLTLVNTLLDWKEMHRLGELKRLEVLKLKDDAFQGKLWQTEKGGFYSLKHLYIGQCDLVVWEASADDFPVLKSLHLNGCDKLQAIPHGLADISTLELVVLHCTNPQVASSARKLQILRLEQGKKGNKSPNSFKVSIYPPEH